MLVGMADYVEVRRTGGIMGRPVTGRVSLDPALGGADTKVAEVQALVERVQFPHGGGRPHPDMFTYVFTIRDRDPVSLVETQLSADLQRLAVLVIEAGLEE